MFEGQNQNQIPGQPQGAASQVSGGVEDIFSATDGAVSAPQAVPGPQLTSVIPGPPTALASGKLKAALAPGAGIPAGQLPAAAGSGFPFKKMLIILLSSAALVGGAVVAFMVLQGRVNAPPAAPALGQPQDQGAQAPVTASDAAAPEVAPEVAPDAAEDSGQDTGGILRSFQQDSIDRALNPIPQDLASIDTDQDGLSDAQEFGHGTNPRLVDSDSDGLSDWEEIAIFGTEPLNRDSDADSYMDGEEVQNGYNPLGTGKLLNFEQASQETL